MDEELYAAMKWLGEQPDTVFLGQSVLYPGTRMHQSFEGVSAEKKIEMPVAEALQLGISIGLSLEGFVPISSFPRMNFLLCAMSALVNDLDKLPLYSDYRSKVIIRTAVGADKPLDPGPQHTGCYTSAIEDMLHTVKVKGTGRSFLCKPLEVYQEAYTSDTSTLVVE